jgi:ribosomal-protein-alanine N-acetyltransferase
MPRSYETERLILKLPEKSFAPLILDYYNRNVQFLEEWEPIKDESFYTLKYQRELVKSDIKNIAKGFILRYWLFKKDDSTRVIGSIALNNVVRGAFQSCHLGYKLDKDEINKGYMTEAVKKAADIAFNQYNLHRIEANIMPKNKASLRTVEKSGFHNEGLAYKYLRINGEWEDHIHMVLLNDKI